MLDHLEFKNLHLMRFRALNFATASVAVAGVFSSASAQSTSKPYTLTELVQLVQGGVSPTHIVGKAKSACIDFHLTAPNVARLRSEGADDTIIEGLRGACYRARAEEVAENPKPQRKVVTKVDRPVTRPVVQKVDTFVVRPVIRKVDAVVVPQVVQIVDNVRPPAPPPPPPPVIPKRHTAAEIEAAATRRMSEAIRSALAACVDGLRSKNASSFAELYAGSSAEETSNMGKVRDLIARSEAQFNVLTEPEISAPEVDANGAQQDFRVKVGWRRFTGRKADEQLQIRAQVSGATASCHILGSPGLK